jgi:hypothetical protein
MSVQTTNNFCNDATKTQAAKKLKLHEHASHAHRVVFEVNERNVKAFCPEPPCGVYVQMLHEEVIRVMSELQENAVVEDLPMIGFAVEKKTAAEGFSYFQESDSNLPSGFVVASSSVVVAVDVSKKTGLPNILKRKDLYDATIGGYIQETGAIFFLLKRHSFQKDNFEKLYDNALRNMAKRALSNPIQKQCSHKVARTSTAVCDLCQKRCCTECRSSCPSCKQTLCESCDCGCFGPLS